MNSVFNNKNLNIVRELSSTDLKLRYQGSIMGYLWTILKPLFLFSVLYVVFTKFLKIGSNIPNYPVYLLLGIIIWNFFTEVTIGTLGSIVARADLIKKVYFPRILLIVSSSITSITIFVFNLVVVFGFMLLNKISFNVSMLLFPLVILELYILSLGVGLILSSLYVKLRDISHVWEIFLQALFYATPILYPISLVPQKFQKVLFLNPVAQIIQDSRYILVTNDSILASEILGRFFWIPYTIPVIILLFGIYFFNISAPKFAEEA